MDYRLTPITIEDKAWLEQLRRSAYRELFFATWGGWDESRHLKHFTECWERGHINTIDVECLRVGMIQLFDHPDSLVVSEIQIDPSHQGRGIGTRVLRDTIAQAHAQQKKVILSIGLKNRRAFELYERLGFRRVYQTDTHDYMECAPE
jgi:ribosomal protein S18 acetylase RimI-like enzyme